KLEEDLVSYFQNFQNIFESSDDSTNVGNAPRELVVVKQDHGVNPPHIDECCYECGNALDGIFCQQCICKSCGKGAHIGHNCPTKVPIISNPEPCNQTMNNELPQTLPSFDTTCYSDKENSVPCVSKPNFVDESSNILTHLYNLLYILVNSAGVILNMVTTCGGPHETFQCQQVIFHEPCCENYGGPYENFQSQPREEKRIEEEQAANARYWKISACCDDDDDDDDVDYTIAITLVLSTEEPIDSLSMGDEHLDTISATESDEVIKSSVEDLVPIPSEFEGIPDTMCDVHLVNNHTPLEA
nr:hypothetical protein [Tanacetum cinerariifolium]